MCQCNPNIRTPWCGRGTCQSPTQRKPEGARASAGDIDISPEAVEREATALDESAGILWKRGYTLTPAAMLRALRAALTRTEQERGIERAKRVETGMLWGHILGPEFDGVPIEQVLRRFVAQQATIAEQAQEIARLKTREFPKARSPYEPIGFKAGEPTR